MIITPKSGAGPQGMIWGYRLRPSGPSLRSQKRNKRRKRGNEATCPGCPRTAGPLSAPNFVSLPPTSVYGPRASQLRLLGQSRAGRPAEARRLRQRPSGPRCAGGEGVAAPPPRWSLGAPNGGEAAPSARARRALPPGRRPSPRPAPRGSTPAGPPRPPGQRSSGEPQARACGLVRVT